MSLPEVLLVLREDQRREANKALLALQTEALCAFAVWDKETGRRLERFKKLLAESSAANERQSNPEQIEQAFTGWGVEIQSTASDQPSASADPPSAD